MRMLALLWPLAVLAIDAVRAEAASCPPYQTAIALDFQTLRPTVRASNALNTTSIRELVPGVPGAVGTGHGDALGLTITTPVFALDARTRIVPQLGGLCVYLETLKAEFGFRDMKVYLASEYPPGSCEYRAILDHENQHVAINMGALQSHAGRVRLDLERILAEEKPVMMPNGSQATRQILDRISRKMDAVLAPFYREIEARNASIDTPNNYDAIGAICKDWSRGNVWPQQSH